MKAHSISYFLIFIFLSFRSGPDEPTNRWAPAGVKVDGSDIEWTEMIPNYDVESKMLYMVANDSTNLYFLIKSDDQLTQMKIMNAGVEVTLDINGKKKGQMGFAFPLPRTKEEQQQEMHEAINPVTQQPDYAQMRKRNLEQMKFIRVHGFEGALGDTIPVQNNLGITARIGFTKDNMLVYEAAIPLAVISKDNLLADPSRLVGYNFKLNAVPKPEHRQNSGNGNGGGGSYAGGQHHGGYGHGGGGSHGNWNVDRTQMFNEHDFWVKQRMAQHAS